MLNSGCHDNGQEKSCLQKFAYKAQALKLRYLVRSIVYRTSFKIAKSFLWCQNQPRLECQLFSIKNIVKPLRKPLVPYHNHQSKFSWYVKSSVGLKTTLNIESINQSIFDMQHCIVNIYNVCSKHAIQGSKFAQPLGSHVLHIHIQK